jgi:hypothetical protein
MIRGRERQSVSGQSWPVYLLGFSFGNNNFSAALASCASRTIFTPPCAETLGALLGLYDRHYQDVLELRDRSITPCPYSATKKRGCFRYRNSASMFRESENCQLFRLSHQVPRTGISRRTASNQRAGGSVQRLYGFPDLPAPAKARRIQAGRPSTQEASATRPASAP